jgi:hypothetical protein
VRIGPAVFLVCLVFSRDCATAQGGGDGGAPAEPVVFVDPITTSVGLEGLQLPLPIIDQGVPDEYLRYFLPGRPIAGRPTDPEVVPEKAPNIPQEPAATDPKQTPAQHQPAPVAPENAPPNQQLPQPQNPALRIPKVNGETGDPNNGPGNGQISTPLGPPPSVTVQPCGPENHSQPCQKSDSKPPKPVGPRAKAN